MECEQVETLDTGFSLRRFASEMDEHDNGSRSQSTNEAQQNGWQQSRFKTPRRHLVAYKPSTAGAPEVFDQFGLIFPVPHCKYNHLFPEIGSLSTFERDPGPGNREYKTAVDGHDAIGPGPCSCIVIYEVVLNCYWLAERMCWQCDGIASHKMLFNDLANKASSAYIDVLCLNPMNMQMGFTFDRIGRQIPLGVLVCREKEVVDLINDRKKWSDGVDPDEYLRKIDQEQNMDNDPSFPRGLGCMQRANQDPIHFKLIRTEEPELQIGAEMDQDTWSAMEQ